MFSNPLYQSIWIRLGTRSRRALRKRVKRWGHPYKYTPRSDLIINLSHELNIPHFEIATALVEMHWELIKHDVNF